MVGARSRGRGFQDVRIVNEGLLPALSVHQPDEKLAALRSRQHPITPQVRFIRAANGKLPTTPKCSRSKTQKRQICIGA